MLRHWVTLCHPMLKHEVCSCIVQGSPGVVNWLVKISPLLSITPLLSVLPHTTLLLANSTYTTAQPWNTQQVPILPLTQLLVLVLITPLSWLILLLIKNMHVLLQSNTSQHMVRLSFIHQPYTQLVFFSMQAKALFGAEMESQPNLTPERFLYV